MPKIVISAFDIDTGKELKYGERGELRVITPGHMLGYYKNEEATAKYFTTDNSGNIWACTGDMGYVDEDGSVFVCGRLDDTYLNELGERIFLFDIEKVLRSSGKIQRCKAVVTSIDGRKTHIIHLVLENGSDKAEALRLIREHCEGRLPVNHMPKLIKLYDTALPVAPSGKIDVVKMECDTSDLFLLE